VAYDFQTGNNKIKLLKEYGSVAQKVLLPIESMAVKAVMNNFPNRRLWYKVKVKLSL
jgi:hypothetical protein